MGVATLNFSLATSANGLHSLGFEELRLAKLSKLGLVIGKSFHFKLLFHFDEALLEGATTKNL